MDMNLTFSNYEVIQSIMITYIPSLVVRVAADGYRLELEEEVCGRGKRFVGNHRAAIGGIDLSGEYL